MGNALRRALHPTLHPTVNGTVGRPSRRLTDRRAGRVARRLTGRTALVVAAWLSVSLPWAPLGRAALPHRADLCDVTRAASQGRGAILAAGPALEGAAGVVGVRGFGFTGTHDGFSYRAIVNARASLVLDASTVVGERAVLDIVLRPTFGTRDLLVELDGQRLGVWPLVGGWQRVAVPLPPRTRSGRLVLTLTNPSALFEDDLHVPAQVRGLLHSIAPRAATSAPPARPEPALAPPPDLTPGGRPLLWLQPGERVDLPLPPAPGLALETWGTRTAGALTISGAAQPPPAPRVRITLISPEGAVDVAADLPATLSIPWNVDLDRPRVRPYTLRLVAPPENTAAVGLVAPRLTGPGPVVPPRPAPLASGRPLVLIAARGLTAEDAEVAAPRPPPSVSLTNAWTTAQVPRAALASLLTGRTPLGHGVTRGRARLADNVPTLAESFRHAGYHTVLVSGPLPGRPLAVDAGGLARGFDAVITSASGAVGPHAGDLLAAAAKALREAGRKPTLVMVIASDVAPPWLPRAQAWRRFAPARGKLPWPPMATTERLAKWGPKPPPATDLPWVRALRRGKVAELGQAVVEHLVQTNDLPLSPVVAVVGLGDESPWALAGPPTPDTARVPVWLWGVKAPAAPPHTPTGAPAWTARSADLSDVAVTLLGRAGVAAPRGAQGVDLRLVGPSPAAAAFPWTAHTLGARGELLSIAGDRATLVPTPGDAERGVVDWQRAPTRKGATYPGRWTPRPRQAVDPRDSIRRALVQSARVFLAAGPRWSRAAYGAPAWPGGPEGYTALNPVPASTGAAAPTAPAQPQISPQTSPEAP